MAARKKTFRLFDLPLLVIAFAAATAFVVYMSRVPHLASYVTDYSGEIDKNAKIATFEGKTIFLPEIKETETNYKVLGTNNSNKWIEVDLSEQKIKAWEGGSLFLESLVSTGLPWYPTPKGEYNIWIKMRATKMSGGSGSTYYYLPNVPYVMFFEGSGIPRWKGYALHGTYWHNDFGRQKSHGCVNLPTPIAERLYHWVSPILPDGRSTVYASDTNPGTRIVIHD